MKFNPQIHHRRSIRLTGYDYAQEGAYFVTLCTENRACIFGEMNDGLMQYTQLGMIAHNEWYKTSGIRNNVALGAFVVMPNHIHGIIIITRSELHSPSNSSMHSPQRTQTELIQGEFNSPLRGEHDNPKQGERGSLQKGECNSPLRSPSQTIGAIIRGYKSAVTKQNNMLGLHMDTPIWQKNYYDHIIRNETSYQHIDNYIRQNPLLWKEDKFFIP
jgi:putative transposase